MINPDERGLVPLIGMSVSMLETMMAEMGMPIIWDEGMTLEEKGRVAGLIWVQVAEEVRAI